MLYQSADFVLLTELLNNCDNGYFFMIKYDVSINHILYK